MILLPRLRSKVSQLDAAIRSDPALPIRIAYDAKAYTDEDQGGGKGKYLAELLSGIGPSTVGLMQDRRYDGDLPVIAHGKLGYLAWQQTTLPALIAAVRADVFLAPYNTAPLLLPARTTLVSVIHDLILLERPTHHRFLSRSKERYRGLLQRQTMRRSNLLVAVSRFTADAIRRHVPEADVRVVYNTIGASWFVERPLGPVAEPDQRYVLLVTSNVPHKNVTRAMEAFARFKAAMPNDPIALRIAGVRSSAAQFQAMAKELGVGGEVHVESFLSESELQMLYRGATCALVPSLKEGFGIPALEAMASGVPLASSNTWSLPEVGGNAPLYFDPTDTGAMASTLERICGNQDLQRELASRGLERAKAFHPSVVKQAIRHMWDDVARMTRDRPDRVTAARATS
ncbi:glycosyltransferase family 1 protein [Sphingomonas sp. BK345]|uniref:glycosyltransferase family 4 protein n=1 Tax=Sphingomonas sp. BK345 TaxID=2586980 RepID=UPI00161E82FB|nr:glycosyltransferase family 1 protein [Sphingomonas sp. BK345]MBB3473155.1 glycosyltransferase involved in cell wall biosynthesis [Sphingomonas sp. BK345]